jgi:hypothetical protein
MARKKIQDRHFEVYITNAEIRQVISDMAERINRPERT